MARFRDLEGVSTQEQLVFEITDLMKPFIEDLDEIKCEFEILNAENQVQDDIRGLRDRSSEAISMLYGRFSRTISYDQWYCQMIVILLPFLQDQFEIRLKLLEVYWPLFKTSDRNTMHSEIANMVMMLGSLSELIQECRDYGTEKDTATALSHLAQSQLSAA